MTGRGCWERVWSGRMRWVVTLAGGMLGGLAGGAMSDRWISHGTHGGRMRAMLPCSIGTAIAVPCFAVAPTANLAAAGYFLFILSNSFGYVSMSATFQDMEIGRAHV